MLFRNCSLESLFVINDVNSLLLRHYTKYNILVLSWGYTLENLDKKGNIAKGKKDIKTAKMAIEKTMFNSNCLITICKSELVKCYVNSHVEKSLNNL